MRMTIAAKKIGDKWEGALVADNRFQHALVGDKLEDILLRGIVALSAVDQPDGVNVLVEITTETEEEIARAKSSTEVRK